MGASPLPPWPHHPRQPGRGPVLGRAAAKAAANQTYATAKGKGKGGDAEKKICFHFRDHGNCPKGDSCPYSHDKELRKRALAARRDAGHQQTLATTKGGGKAGGKGGGKNGKPKAKAKAKAKAKSKAGAKPPGAVCPFFAKNGSCRKGANCDMVHSLATTGGNQVALPSNWGTSVECLNEQSLCSLQHPDRQRGRPGGRPPSTAGSVPATAETLQAELRELYRILLVTT